MNGDQVPAFQIETQLDPLLVIASDRNVSPSSAL
jgi:hypothetical protein